MRSLKLFLAAAVLALILYLFNYFLVAEPGKSVQKMVIQSIISGALFCMIYLYLKSKKHL